MSKNNAGAAVRAASAIKNIAKGASTGGLHGAILGAVTSFLPEIIKAAAIIIIAFLVLPTLIFAAIPNILFGYDNANANEIIELTNKAYSIDAAYKSVQNYSQAEIDRIIAEAQAAYTSEESETGFDNVEINTATDNTNIYWFIAITSVAHKQDLYSMSEESIKSMIISKLVHTVSINSTTVGEGDAATTMRTLKIDIEDLDPYALMDKLGFNDEEKNWAHVLYSTMADEQYVGINDSDGAGYYNTDYGSITFTDNTTSVIYYNQTDSRWGNIMYGKTGTIGTSGCGPTALAIAVASLRDSSITPDDVAKWSYDNGYRCEGSGSYHSLIPNGGAHYGLTVEGIGRDAKKLVEALSEGKLVIAIMAKGHFTSSGHFIVLRGITSDGKIKVADPASVKRSEQEWNLSIIVNEARRGANAGGPFWVVY